MMPLQREDWVRTALRRLATSGIEAVRVEALARDLKTTKGSFYWHFKHRRELLAAMLREWEVQKDQMMVAVAQERTPTERVERFVQLIAAYAVDPESVALENAIFAWAHQDPAVAKRAAAMEAKRIGNAKRLLEELGFPPADATWWAEAGYTLFVGMMNRTARDPAFRRQPLAEYHARMVEAAELLVARNARDVAPCGR
jgi:AcrR family transcriptional regulator